MAVTKDDVFEFIDNYDEHLDTFCEAAKRVLKGR